MTPRTRMGPGAVAVPGMGHARTKDGRRRRALLVWTAAVALTVGMAVAMPRVFSMTLTPPTVQYVEVTVAPGQTLWDIAEAHKAARTDTRGMVYKIRVANELADATVYPGQVLRVPAGVR